MMEHSLSPEEELIQLREQVASLQEENDNLKNLIQQAKKTAHSVIAPYLTEEVLEEMHKNKGQLTIGGERRYVAMLFTDLRDSTAIAEQMQTQDFIRMLNHYLEEMIEIINAWQGNILDFVGDAIVVVFGAPRPNDSASLNAVACAVSMQRRMNAINEWNREQGYPNLYMGIGIHAGEAILGNIGSETRTKYDMIGRNVNLTSRIEGCSKGGQILISSSVLHDGGDQIHLLPGGDRLVSLKGIQGETLIHEVIGFGRRMLPGYEKT